MTGGGQVHRGVEGGGEFFVATHAPLNTTCNHSYLFMRITVIIGTATLTSCTWRMRKTVNLKKPTWSWPYHVQRPWD